MIPLMSSGIIGVVQMLVLAKVLKHFFISDTGMLLPIQANGFLHTCGQWKLGQVDDDLWMELNVVERPVALQILFELAPV